MKPLRKWPIVRTLLGKNGAGKKLNKVLPFRKQREVLSSIIRGAADVAPVPKAKDAALREKIETIRDIAEQAKFERAGAAAEKAVLTIADLLDDGQLNDSAELSPRLRKQIRLGSSYLLFGLIVYEVVGVFAGWPGVMSYLSYLMEAMHG